MCATVNPATMSGFGGSEKPCVEVGGQAIWGEGNRSLRIFSDDGSVSIGLNETVSNILTCFSRFKCVLRSGNVEGCVPSDPDADALCLLNGYFLHTTVPEKVLAFDRDRVQCATVWFQDGCQAVFVKLRRDGASWWDFPPKAFEGIHVAIFSA